MNNLLIFFALPIATIIIAAILQRLIKCPITVAALVFAIFLIVTFAISDTTFLIATLAYTLLALITAYIVCLFCNGRMNCGCNSCQNNNDDDDDRTTQDLLREILANLSDSNNNNNNGCGCNNNRQNSNLSDELEDIMNNDSNTNGNAACGCNRNRYYRYRRY